MIKSWERSTGNDCARSNDCSWTCILCSSIVSIRTRLARPLPHSPFVAIGLHGMKQGMGLAWNTEKRAEHPRIWTSSRICNLRYSLRFGKSREVPRPKERHADPCRSYATRCGMACKFTPLAGLDHGLASRPPMQPVGLGARQRPLSAAV